MAYTSRWIVHRQEILDIANQVKTNYPEDFAIAHKRTADGREVPGNDRFIRRVAIEVSKVFPDCGLNGKRGDVNNISRDVLAFPNPAGCRDASGRHLGLELIDIIGKAGAPDAHLTWADVTVDTMESNTAGAWVKPEMTAGESGDGASTKIPPFPPRDQVLNFVSAIDEKYEKRGREPIELYVDLEGLAVWVGEYLRYRQLGKTHDEAQGLAFAEIDKIWAAEDKRRR